MSFAHQHQAIAWTSPFGAVRLKPRRVSLPSISACRSLISSISSSYSPKPTALNFLASGFLRHGRRVVMGYAPLPVFELIGEGIARVDQVVAVEREVVEACIYRRVAPDFYDPRVYGTDRLLLQELGEIVDP